LLGNKIANLVTESAQDAGEYTQVFNTNQYHLSPGVYLISFNMGGKVETQKLVIE
jgi:hypothetical protein